MALLKRVGCVICMQTVPSARKFTTVACFLAAKNLIVDCPDAITHRGKGKEKDSKHTSDSNNWLNVFYSLQFLFPLLMLCARACVCFVGATCSASEKKVHAKVALLLSLNITQCSNGFICVLAFVTYFLRFCSHPLPLTLSLATKRNAECSIWVLINFLFAAF